MWNTYDDIRSKIAMEPTWYDEHSVPRYCDFAPERTANIYTDEAALVLIACQSCTQHFRVAMTYRPERPSSIAEAIKLKVLEYGDPPNTGCCESGASMTSQAMMVLEYWKRDNFEWKRDSSFEVEVYNETDSERFRYFKPEQLPKAPVVVLQTVDGVFLDLARRPPDTGFTDLVVFKQSETPDDCVWRMYMDSVQWPLKYGVIPEGAHDLIGPKVLDSGRYRISGGAMLGRAGHLEMRALDGQFTVTDELQIK
jgi:hypothetical protein